MELAGTPAPRAWRIARAIAVIALVIITMPIAAVIFLVGIKEAR